MICFGRLFRKKSSKPICEISDGPAASPIPSTTSTVIENPIDTAQLTVSVVSPTGRIARFLIPKTTIVHALKLKAIEHFTQSTDVLMFFVDNINEIAQQYKLMKIDLSEDELPHMNEDNTLQVIGVQDFDELYLIKIKPKRFVAEENASTPVPNEKDISLATVNVQSSTNHQLEHPIVDVNELLYQCVEYDIGKIVLTVAKMAAYVIGAGPYATKLIGWLKKKLLLKRKQECNAIQCLMDLGFDHDPAAYALRINNNNYAASLDWLICSYQRQTLPEIGSQSTISVQSFTDNTTTQEKVEVLLQIIEIYNRQRTHHKAPEFVIDGIVEMGFTRHETVLALCKMKQNPVDACLWLCGERTDKSDSFPEDSPTVQALQESPILQKSLDNPNLFLAYMDILENGVLASVMATGRCRETADVMIIIQRILYEEKRNEALSQFNLNRF